VSPDDPIPQQYGPHFLEWLRLSTERVWDKVTEKTLSDFERTGVGGASWRRGTRWIGGLSEAEINKAERRYGLYFPADYRLFLRALHSTTPRRSGARFIDDGSMRAIERPAFFDWQRDDEEIRTALAWPLEGLLFDVEQNALWLPSWGARPNTAEERKARVEALLADAPKLVPIVGHRYIVPVEPHVVLSVYQSDVIVYGNDLRAFLLAELGPMLGLPSDGTWANASAGTIPFWGELAE
jgi:hypothetical protein